MKTFHYTLCRSVASFGMLLAALLSLTLDRLCAVDETISKGVWKLLYRATDAQVSSATWLAADDDGDGIKNQSELDAGTDPFDPNSGLRVTSFDRHATTVSLTFPTVGEKTLHGGGEPGLVPSNWAPVAPPVQVVGDGTDKTLVVPRSAGGFFRVLVQDLVPTIRHVSDWAEQVVGLNPAIATSNGQWMGMDCRSQTVRLRMRNSQRTARHHFASFSCPRSLRTALQSAPSLGKICEITAEDSRSFCRQQSSIMISAGRRRGDGLRGVARQQQFREGEVSKEIVVTPSYNAIAWRAYPSWPPARLAIIHHRRPGWAAVIINPTNAPSGTGLLARYYGHGVLDVRGRGELRASRTYNFTRDASPTTTGTIVSPTPPAICPPCRWAIR
jgi:hypothetical protein